MNKYIGLALAATLSTSASAEANNELFNWYGSIRIQLQDSNKDELEFNDNYSRIGAYGSTEIMDGIKANYNVEFRLNTGDGSFAGDSGARLANVGLEGDFGSVLIGKQYSPVWNYTDNAIDIFADIDESAGCTNESAGVICHTHRYGLYGQDAAGNGHYIEVLRPDRAVTYTTPDMSGFQGSVMVLLNNGDVKANASGDKNKDIVGYNAAAKYTIGDFTISASRFDASALLGENKIDSYQLAYNLEKLSLAARYQKSNDMRFYVGLNSAGEIVEEDVYEVYAGYKFSTIQLQATYGHVSMDSPSQLTVSTNQLVIDVIYPHKYGSFYVEYSAWGDEAEEVFEASDTLIVGLRFDF
jgi:predicted porin